MESLSRHFYTALSEFYKGDARIIRVVWTQIYRYQNKALSFENDKNVLIYIYIYKFFCVKSRKVNSKSYYKIIWLL